MPGRDGGEVATAPGIADRELHDVTGEGAGRHVERLLRAGVAPQDEQPLLRTDQ